MKNQRLVEMTKCELISLLEETHTLKERMEIVQNKIYVLEKKNKNGVNKGSNGELKKEFNSVLQGVAELKEGLSGDQLKGKQLNKVGVAVNNGKVSAVSPAVVPEEIKSEIDCDNNKIINKTVSSHRSTESSYLIPLLLSKCFKKVFYKVY